MTSRPRLVLASAALVALALTGCTDDPTSPDPSGSASGSASASGSGSGSPSASPSLQDRSAELLSGAAPLTEIARATAAPGSSYAGSTFTFYQLTRSDASTVLVWRVTGGTGSSSRDALVRQWEYYPVMVAGGKEYSVVTFDKQDDSWSAVSNPALRLDAGTQAPPQYALYPPLPAGTTEVTLKSRWFASVKVPVTDAPAAPTG